MQYYDTLFAFFRFLRVRSQRSYIFTVNPLNDKALIRMSTKMLNASGK